MNFFAVLLLSLFISVKSSNAAEDGTFDKNTKINMNSSTATENGTFHENAKKNGNASLNVVLRNDAKQESQLARFRRSRSYYVFSKKKCYIHYFVGEKPPTGFKKNFLRYRHICQGDCSIIPGSDTVKGCFSTLYDLDYKIPIYAAYVLRPSDWDTIGHFHYKYWQKETGYDSGLHDDIKDILLHIDSMYSDTRDLPCIHKGHLVPAATYSFSEKNRQSTFVYTNAVPQYEKFNSGQWATYEDKIRNYGNLTCAKKHGGDLYLLTGTSRHRIGKNDYSDIDDMGIKPLEYMPEYPNIVIPNSMWTAGCCVRDQQVFGSFAVIGNNDWNKFNLLTSVVTVKELEKIIGIKLFPGNKGC